MRVFYISTNSLTLLLTLLLLTIITVHGECSNLEIIIDDTFSVSSTRMSYLQRLNISISLCQVSNVHHLNQYILANVILTEMLVVISKKISHKNQWTTYSLNCGKLTKFHPMLFFIFHQRLANLPFETRKS